MLMGTEETLLASVDRLVELLVIAKKQIGVQFGPLKGQQLGFKTLLRINHKDNETELLRGSMFW